VTGSDSLKLFVMLILAIAVVGLICHARVDLGMSWEQMNAKLEEWWGPVLTFGSVVITLVIANRFGKER